MELPRNLLPLLLCAVALTTASCGKGQGAKGQTKESPAEAREITQGEATTIAKEEHLRRGGGPVRVMGASLERGMWIIALVRIPEVVGEQTLVVVSKSGKVLRYYAVKQK